MDLVIGLVFSPNETSRQRDRIVRHG